MSVPIALTAGLHARGAWLEWARMARSVQVFAAQPADPAAYSRYQFFLMEVDSLHDMAIRSTVIDGCVLLMVGVTWFVTLRDRRRRRSTPSN